MRRRLPDFQSILQVYAVIAVMFAGWTVTAFLWKLSAWLLLLNLGEVFTIFAYAMTANFLESLLVLALLLVACGVFPAHFLREDFVVRGTILAIGLIAALIAFVGAQMLFGIGVGFRLLIPPLVIVLLMVFFIHRFWSLHRVRSLAVWLSDRVTVFLLILLPLFGLLSLYVLFRNIV